ncbi:MAG TPA: EAL domain-containing protein [Methylophilaceae bacterium]|jgi:EAL and modified HD-GYP domain-containing signal transduction protein
MNDQSTEIFLGRQPILDAQQGTFAYELLFRSGQHLTAGVTDDLLASATVIINTISELGLDSVLENHAGFINVSRSLLMGDVLELLPHNRIVIELLETVEIDNDVIERCRQLKAQGFRLALDDFEYTPVYDALFPIVDIIKFDVMLSSREEITKTLTILKRWPHLKMLAEKVETQEEFDYFKTLNFNLYQGYFFAKPSVLSTKKSNPNQITLLRALGLLMSDAEVDEIERPFKESPDLMLGLLRLVNSVGMGLTRKIGTLHQALVILGRQQLQRWVQLLMYAKSGNTAAGPLMQMAAVRAKTMELLSQHHVDKRYASQEATDHAFMTGILSLVDAALGVDINEILDQLGLIDEVRQAILNREGFLGKLLLLVEKCETEEFDAVAELLKELNISPVQLSDAQLAAMQWAGNLHKDAN